MFSVDHLTIDFSGTPLFEDVSFLINDKEKIALAGKNGAGKSTMLKIFSKLIEPTKGIVNIPKGSKVGYLPQHLLVKDTHTVLEEVEKAFSEVLAVEKQIKSLTHALETRTDYESSEYMDIITKLTEENDQLTLMGGANRIAEIEKTLMGLGFERKDFTRLTSEFSGGWRMRIELAKILLQHPDILLLDEPTNHLDIESIQWLEDFLKTSTSALLLVSHDRAFLDAVTNRTIEISLGQIYDYKANYSKYIELRKERREQQRRTYENQQKMIADTEDFISRFRYKTSKAVQVQSRVKQLDKLKRVEVDQEDNATFHLKFPAAPHSGVLPVEIEGLSKSYDDLLVLDNIDLHIKRGEKIAFVGKNGEGKSTLVKCIMDEIEYSGQMKLGYGVKIGYFAQNQASLLDESQTVFETIDNVAVGDIRTKIRSILGAFMFGGEASDKKVQVLSGGERSRLAMIRLLLEPVNLLILDEPTNHLDLNSKDVLKEAIRSFEGTVIIVSHDRDFLDGLVDKVFEFKNHKMKEYLGGIHAFLDSKALELVALQKDAAMSKVVNKMVRMEKKEEENLALKNTTKVQTTSTLIEAEKKDRTHGLKHEKSSDSSSRKTHKTQTDGAKVSFEEQKERRKKTNKLERDLAKAEKDIEDYEALIAELEQQFAQAEASDKMAKTYSMTQDKLKRRLVEWELLGEQLEALKASY